MIKLEILDMLCNIILEIVWMFVMFMSLNMKKMKIKAWFDWIEQVFSDLKVNLTLKMKIKKFKRNEIALH